MVPSRWTSASTPASQIRRQRRRDWRRHRWSSSGDLGKSVGEDPGGPHPYECQSQKFYTALDEITYRQLGDSSGFVGLENRDNLDLQKRVTVKEKQAHVQTETIEKNLLDIDNKNHSAGEMEL
ncbi:unnamed protein product [Polarella glacialis]|uniref:Uncharacterized protein n=1 Tax=Polarella glacialis TaxID=89957 RepID=A0A813L6X0_POLGL|nr:unnamed protein product [Polarella glacialis]